MSSIHAFLEALGEPFLALVTSSDRVFWPYLLGALVLSILVFLLQYPSRRSPRSCARFVFARRVWVHESTFLDLKLMVAKGLLRAAWAAPWALSAFAIAVWMVGTLDRLFGMPEPTSLGRTSITILYTAVLFLCWDFSRFLLHLLAHRVPPLWELHKVHHSAEVMTPLTIFRSHPVETFLFAARGVLVTGVVTGVFFHLFRGQAVQAELVGVNAVGFVFNILGGNLRHSHVWLSYGRIVEHVLISPAQHQIHHSARRAHYDRNFGSWLAVWDWLFGSLAIAGRKRQHLRFGLDEDTRNHDPHRLGSALVRPVLGAVATLWPWRSPARR